MEIEKLLFLRSDDNVGPESRGADDHVLTMAADGRLRLASESEASKIFTDPITKKEFRIVAFMEYRIETDEPLFIGDKLVTAIVGHFDLRYHNFGLIVQNPKFILEDNSEIYGRTLVNQPDVHFAIEPALLPRIFNVNGECIFEAQSASATTE